MKKTTHYFRNALLVILFIGATATNAQIELKVLDQMETRFSDVNDEGIGVYVYGYYDFETEQLTPETEAFMLVSTNNNNDVAGMMFYDMENFILNAGYKKDDVWTIIDPLPGQDPNNGDELTAYGISPNSKYIVGQTNIGNSYGGFLFDTETQELIGAFDPEGESGAMYAVNDNGIMVGWIDRPDGGGTLRVPAYRTTDGEFHFIPEGQYPTFNINTINDINSSNVMVGDFDLQPFIYDMETDTFTSYEIPEGADYAAFSSISENGIAVGYADVDWQVRDAIIYHPSLGDQPLYLKDVLADNGVDVPTNDGLLGTAISISPNGKYIVGWVNGSPQYAEGWMLYLDELILGTDSVSQNQISIYPNPVQDIMHINGTETIDAVSVYTLTGQHVSNITTNELRTQVDLSGLAKGVYMVRVSSNGGVENLKVIKQ